MINVIFAITRIAISVLIARLIYRWILEQIEKSKRKQQGDKMIGYNTRLLEEILANQNYIIAMLESKIANDELKEIQRELEERQKEFER